MTIYLALRVIFTTDTPQMAAEKRSGVIPDKVLDHPTRAPSIRLPQMPERRNPRTTVSTSGSSGIRSILLVGSRWHNGQSSRVNAIAQTCGCRASGKHKPAMRITLRTTHLGSHHAKRSIAHNMILLHGQDQPYLTFVLRAYIFSASSRKRFACGYCFSSARSRNSDNNFFCFELIFSGISGKI